jgi:hypothetical protein
MRKLFLVLFILLGFVAFPCNCPTTGLSKEECNKYEIIFKGRVVSSKDCDFKYGEAVFEVQELYKGNATKEFKMLFDCKGDCAKKFQAGEEWIIYSRYKQIDNAMMDWCSRSRKYFRNDKEDYYSVLYGNDYDDESKFLRENLGLHRLLQNKVVVENRNIHPSTMQSAMILVVSLLAIILFYFLFNRFVK